MTVTTRHRRVHGAKGFTLIEIMVVITIIGLLMTFTAVAVGRYREAGRVTEAQARITSLSLLAGSYAERMGDVPPSRLADLGITGANALNEGIEAFVVALRHEDYSGPRPDESWYGNTDDDRHGALRLVDHGDRLLEVLDPWDNPFLYVDHLSYGDDPAAVRLGPGEDGQDTSAGALVNEMTGTWHRFDSYQIRSAGPDGKFDTDDDIANFEVPRDEH